MNLLLSDLDVGAYDANCHLRPPLRDQRDRSKLRKAIGSGAVDAICAHHEPHDAEAKAAPFSMTDPGASTLDAFLPNLLALVEAGVFELSPAIAAASTAPHRILNQSGGDLALGSIADLCVFDPGFEWTLSEETMLSRGKNSPFLGQTLRGKNRLTIVAGRIVFDALK